MLFSLAIFLSTSIKAQEIGHGIGSFSYKINTVREIVNQTEFIFDSSFKTVWIGQNLLNSKRLRFRASYSWFSGWTGFSFNPQMGFRGFGTAASKLRRVSLSTGYNIFANKSRLQIYPQFLLEYQYSIIRTEGYHKIRSIPPGTSDIVGAIYAEAHKADHLIPSLGVMISFRLIKGLHIMVDGYWSYGRMPYQTQQVVYSLNGVPQPTAEWNGDGDGFVQTLGLAYRFGKN